MDKRAPTTFILVTVVLDAMGIGLILPVMPDLLAEIQGATIGEAAVWGGILSASFALMQFLFSPTVGNLSDRFGRRPILLVSLAVMCLDYILMAVAGTIWLLLFGRIIGGIAAATHATAGAYMADISPPEKKSQNFGLISACFGLGFILGPVLGGLLAEFGPRAPFIAAAILSGMNFIYGYFILPETLPAEKRRPLEWRRANPVGGVRYIGALPGVRALLFVWLFYQLANMVYPAIWAYYTKEAFGWDPSMVGISLGIYGISMAVVQGGLIRLIIPRLGESRTVWIGLAFNAAVLSVIAFIWQGWVLMMLIPLSALGAVVAPALQGVMSQRASDDQQGELQGVLSSLNALGTIVTPLVMTWIFFVFTAPDAPIYLPGAAFLASSALMVISFAIYAVSVRKPMPATS